MALPIIPFLIGALTEQVTGSGVLAAAASGIAGYALGQSSDTQTGGLVSMANGSTALTTGEAAGVGIISGPQPGVPEPPAAMVRKTWKTKAFATTYPAVGEYWVYHWILVDGRHLTWNERKKEFKIWRPKKMIVLSSDPRMSQVNRLVKTYHKVTKQIAKKNDDLVLKSTLDNLRKKIDVLEAKKRK